MTDNTNSDNETGDTLSQPLTHSTTRHTVSTCAVRAAAAVHIKRTPPEIKEIHVEIGRAHV